MGALRGIETFLQLLEGDRQGYFIPSVRIQDKPRFPWRGLLIDAGRHFEPVEVIKRNLDGMAAVKLNVLHWHLTEDQGFRIESKRYPRLHQMAIDVLSVPAMSDDPERVFSGTRRTISWDRARLSAETIEKLECLGNWVKNDLIRKLYVAVDDKIMDISGDRDKVFLSPAYILNYFYIRYSM